MDPDWGGYIQVKFADADGGDSGEVKEFLPSDLRRMNRPSTAVSTIESLDDLDASLGLGPVKEPESKPSDDEDLGGSPAVQPTQASAREDLENQFDRRMLTMEGKLDRLLDLMSATPGGTTTAKATAAANTQELSGATSNGIVSHNGTKPPEPRRLMSPPLASPPGGIMPQAGPQEQKQKRRDRSPRRPPNMILGPPPLPPPPVETQAEVEVDMEQQNPARPGYGPGAWAQEEPWGAGTRGNGH